MTEAMMTKTTSKPAKAHSKAASASTTGGTRNMKSVATSKSETLIALLSRSEGATIDAMMKASGWQAHSVRGFLAGTLKKKGKAVSSEKTDAGRIYRIAGGEAA
jgi:hypothetical protein